MNKFYPRFEHDCFDCVLLGYYREDDVDYDMYFCPNEPSILGRYSDEGGDYCSGMAFALTSNKGLYPTILIKALQTKHKQQIIDYYKKFHKFENGKERFAELLLISETNPEDYPTLVGRLKYYVSIIEEYFLGIKDE